jgi:geranylgeranyl reductase family protein
MSGSQIPPEQENVVHDGGQLWDAMVVGAGPAGCAAAYDLATAGLSVLLLDHKDFPRAKACAGGLTSKAVQALRYSIAPVVRKVVGRVRLEGDPDFLHAAPDMTARAAFVKESRMKLANDGKLYRKSGVNPSCSPADAVVLKSREPICVMTVRAELDAYCLRQTIAAGACLRKIAGVQQIERRGDEVHLLAPGESYRARFLVGADGASGQTRRLCAAGSWFSRGFALEVQTAAPPEEVDLTFDFASVSNGYAWIFPKGDHLNVGVYSLSPAAGLTRSLLLSYVEKRVGADPVDGVVGQYLGIGAGENPAEYVQADLRDRVFLVGDAGGFVDPLTGEGIYGALVSGQAAAKAILAEVRGESTAADAFARHIAGYRQTLRFSSRAAAAFYANPSRGFRAMRLPFVRRSLVRTYTHGLNVNSLAMRIALAHC